MEKFVKHRGLGGRFLPSGATKGNMPTKGTGFDSKNRETFEAVKGSFDGHVLMQNIGDGKMTQLETSGIRVPK